jgi:putative inorganic carbon (hco3(-)) transporter
VKRPPRSLGSAGSAVNGHHRGTAPSRTTTPAGASPAPERVGLFLWLFLVWLWFEFGRPSNPMGIPMLLSILLTVGWLVRPDKRWTRRSAWLVGLLLVMAAGIPFAVNTYTAFWDTYGMAVIVLCICIPLPSLLTSVRKIKVWVYAFVAAAMYVGVWALFHNGYGPSGAGGGQDENYVAAHMTMAIPFAYFSIFAERRRVVKALLVVSVVVFTGATIVGFSRGGFLGLAAVVLYCLARSPRKVAGFTVVAIVCLAALLFAGPAYWQEMTTITDTNESTADLRLEIWSIGLRMWAANPVLGVGPGNFRWRVGEYQSEEQLEKYGRSLAGSIVAHSLFVDLFAELGTAGVVVVGALVLGTWRDLRRIRRNLTERPAGSTARELLPLAHYGDAVTASMLACLVTGTFLSLLYFSYLWLLIAVGSGISEVARRRTAAPA